MSLRHPASTSSFVYAILQKGEKRTFARARHLIFGIEGEKRKGKRHRVEKEGGKDICMSSVFYFRHQRQRFQKESGNKDIRISLAFSFSGSGTAFRRNFNALKSSLKYIYM